MRNSHKMKNYMFRVYFDLNLDYDSDLNHIRLVEGYHSK